jgi:hypothetical protein
VHAAGCTYSRTATACSTYSYNMLLTAAAAAPRALRAAAGMLLLLAGSSHILPAATPCGSSSCAV